MGAGVRLFFLLLGTGVCLPARAEPPLPVDRCVTQAEARPPYFSFELSRCLRALPTAAILDALTWKHPRQELQTRVRIIAAKRFAERTLTAEDAGRLATLATTSDQVPCRADLLQDLGQSAPGRAALGGVLDNGKADVFSLLASIEYLRGADLDAFVPLNPTSPPANPPEDQRRIDRARAEIQRAYLTVHPFDVLHEEAPWKYRDVVAFRVDNHPEVPLIIQGDRWLCALAREDRRAPGADVRARDLIRQRLLTGDMNDAARLFDLCLFQKTPRGAAVDRKDWSFELVRQWILRQRPRDLAEEAASDRFGRLLAVMSSAAGPVVAPASRHPNAWGLTLLSAVRPGEEIRWPVTPSPVDREHEEVRSACNRVWETQWYSADDLRVLGLRAPAAPAPPAVTPARDEPGWSPQARSWLISGLLRGVQGWARHARPDRLEDQRKEPLLRNPEHVPPLDPPRY
jgi:hypothetical protein